MLAINQNHADSLTLSSSFEFCSQKVSLAIVAAMFGQYKNV